MIVVGFLVENDPVENYDRGNYGLLKGGGGYLLGVQVLACVCIIVWSATITFLLLVVSVGGTRVGWGGRGAGWGEVGCGRVGQAMWYWMGWRMADGVGWCGAT